MVDTDNPALERMLQQAAALDASDIHLVAGEPPIYRVRGALQRGEDDPLTADDIREIVQAEIGADQAARIGSQQAHAIIMCEAPGVVSGHMCVTRAAGALTASIRIIPTALPAPEVARVPQALLDAADSPSGLVITAGEPGSGKTTMAYMLLEHINATRPVRILTVEHFPSMRLEAKQAVVTQQSVGSDVPDFPAALHAALRQDPDVLFVGEMRDLATLEACIALADTGHLVITQVNTGSPAGVIDRLVEVHPEELRAPFRVRLAATLRAISVQTLLPRADGPGRTVAYGLLVPDKQMREAIAARRDIHDRDTPLPDGCRALADETRTLQREGLITDSVADEAISRLQ